MGKYLKSFYPLLALVIFGIAFWPIQRISVRADTQVTAQTGTVGNVADTHDHNPTGVTDTIAATDSVHTPNLVVTSAQIAPPDGFFFDQFGGDFMAFRDHYQPTHVNVYDDSTNGVYAVKDVDTVNKIQVEFDYLKPQTAAMFVPWMQGNLFKQGNVKVQKFWAAKLNTTFTDRLILSSDKYAVLRSSPSVTVQALPLHNGSAVNGVSVTFTVTQDAGGPLTPPITITATQGETGPGVPWTLPTAADAAHKYTITATATGYASDHMDIQLLNGQWVERAPPYTGFDNYNTAAVRPGFNQPPWLVVQKNNASTASELQISDPVPAGTQIHSAPASITVAPTTPTGDNTETNVTGTVANPNDNPFAQATAITGALDTIAKMNISVKSPISFPVRIIYLDDHNNPNQGAADLPDQSAAATGTQFALAHTLWSNQANVNLSLDRASGHIDVTSQHNKLGDNPTPTQIHSLTGIPGPPDGGMLVLIAWNPSLEGDSAVGEFFQTTGICYIWGQWVLDGVMAHELGHALGIGGGPGNFDGDYSCSLPGRSHDLMGYNGIAPQYRIHKFQADIANPH